MLWTWSLSSNLSLSYSLTLSRNAPFSAHSFSESWQSNPGSIIVVHVCVQMEHATTVFKIADTERNPIEWAIILTLSLSLSPFLSPLFPTHFLCRILPLAIKPIHECFSHLISEGGKRETCPCVNEWQEQCRQMERKFILNEWEEMEGWWRDLMLVMNVTDTGNHERRKFISEKYWQNQQIYEKHSFTFGRFINRIHSTRI